MSGELLQVVEELAVLWPRLQTVTGAPGAGQPSHKSRPPATLTVVALVMEVAGAAREGALDLAHQVHRDTVRNLQCVCTALQQQPDHDLVEWWTGAVLDWTRRARLVLGYDPALMRHVYGAACPHCGATMVDAQQDGQRVRIPAIGIAWDGAGDEWVVHNVHCLGCGNAWARGQDLDTLVLTILAHNTTREVMT